METTYVSTDGWMDKEEVRYKISPMEYYSAMLCLAAQSCPARWDPMDCSSPGSFARGDSPGKNPGVGCPALL